jgi:hypothetical protein
MERYAIIEEHYVLFETGVLFSIRFDLFKAEWIGTHGYLCVSINDKCKLLHRLLAKAFIPNPDNKPFVDHIDHDRLNNNLENLRWSSMAENTFSKQLGILNRSGEQCITKCIKTGGNLYWHVDVRANGKRLSKNFRCYAFDTKIPDYVKDCRDEFKRELHGDFAFIPNRST